MQLLSGTVNNVISIIRNIFVVISIAIIFLNKFKKSCSVLVVVTLAFHSPIHLP